ncbi:hypothetical protein AARAC_000951 [Aspergillus arachidicola]|uniref:Uncharacterized protein n=1 Tax=Aspergillus arachidicola TaxID=656916 RepID=A0A2G7G555_9EURO|nr:hypothetical protein AARAC_000951 [Aspergillus arachidicola]
MAKGFTASTDLQGEKKFITIVSIVLVEAVLL